MRALVTADWQTRPSNLPECRQAADRVLHLIDERGLKLFVVAGDIKDAYNPVDLRVIDFWRRFLGQVIEHGASPVLLLGNHDRASLQHNDWNWLPILGDAGAEVFDAPGRVNTASGSRLWLLPFSRSVEHFGEQLERLRSGLPPDPARDVLVFHETLKGAAWNRQTRVEADETPIGLSALRPADYRFVLGGDIHMGQQIGENAWYVGSPFPHTWGECNQAKRFALVLEDELDFVSTGLPGWHDPAVSGFRAPESWEGARVRLSVPVSAGSAYGAELQAVQTKARQQYPGAAVTVRPVPEAGLEVAAQTRPAADGEAEAVQQYVDAVLPDDSDKGVLSAYLLHRLAQVGGAARDGGGVRYRSVSARNFLCFEELDLQLDTPGITVVTGINRDRPGKSNGAGKSSLLNALPVALFGRTFKGQEADHWKRRGTRKASVAAEFDLPGGQTVRVERTRGPSATRMWLDGEEVTAGGRQRDTAKDIEAFLGTTWEAFGATVFLSQEEIGAFLWGTPKQRHEVIARLQDLERFERAWEAVGQDVRRTESAHAEMREAVRDAGQRLTALEEMSHVREELDRARKNMAEAKRESEALAAKVPATPDAKRARQARERWTARVLEAEQARARASEIRRNLKALDRQPDVCPTCKRPLPVDRKTVEDRRKELKAALGSAREAVEAMERLETRAGETEAEERARWERDQTAYRKARAQADAADRRHDEARAEVRRWKKRAERERGVVQDLRRTLDIRKRAADGLQEEVDFLKGAQGMLARDGLPAWLLESLIPRLNAAADHYADLFTDGEIRVRFVMDRGRVGVDVLNPSGGERLRDQSTGEGRVAALVSSFALRDTAPHGNILVLDEPGAGLDAESYRVFAAGLQKAAGNGAVFVVTHDATLAAELGSARRVEIEKQAGVARIVG